LIGKGSGRPGRVEGRRRADREIIVRGWGNRPKKGGEGGGSVSRRGPPYCGSEAGVLLLNLVWRRERRRGRGGGRVDEG
jgi:hypothetical protein